jgi:DNA-directed RNA polymerase subunit F
MQQHGEHNEMEETTTQVPPITLSVDEQRAMLDFAERYRSISPERAEELAEFVTEERGQKAVQKVLSYAGWIAKGR